MSKISYVQVPVTGYITVTVKHADGLREADIIGLALRLADFKVTSDDPETVEPGEFGTHRAVINGNTCHAVCNDAEVIETVGDE